MASDLLCGPKMRIKVRTISFWFIILKHLFQNDCQDYMADETSKKCMKGITVAGGRK